MALSMIRPGKNYRLQVAKLLTGQSIYIYTNDYVGEMIRLFGDLDPCITRFILNNIFEGDIFVDVGANLGVVTLPASSKVGGRGKVYAVEPNNNISNILEKSVNLNNFSNVNIINLAVSDFQGKLELYIPHHSFGQASLERGGGTPQSCNVTTLDRLLPKEKVRLLKVDVEGHEHKVLMGGLNFLRDNDVDIIVFESHLARGSFPNREEVILLLGLNYTIYELRRGFMCKPVIFSTNMPAYTPKSADFIGVKPGVKLFL